MKIWKSGHTDSSWQSWKCSHSLSDKFSYNYEDNIKNNDYMTPIQSMDESNPCPTLWLSIECYCIVILQVIYHACWCQHSLYIWNECVDGKTMQTSHNTTFTW